MVTFLLPFVTYYYIAIFYMSLIKTVMIQDSIKIVLCVLLVTLLFTRKQIVSKKAYNDLMTVTMMLFTVACFYDIVIALLIVSLGYVAFSKIKVKETFNGEKKKPTPTPTPKTKPTVNTPVEKKEPILLDERTTNCQNITDMNETFLKEYDINLKKLDEVQNNIFDKYNYNVFFNELGENALDIQGIYNHEVIGFEKN